jgi:hypothetical protein
MKLCALRFGIAAGCAMAIINVFFFLLMHFFGNSIMGLLRTLIEKMPQHMAVYAGLSTIQQFVWYFIVGALTIVFYNMFIGKKTSECCH